MSDWIPVDDKTPKFPRQVIAAYISDADGEPCLDVGTAYLFPDGTWRHGGFFYAMGKDIPYEIRESKIEVTHWMPLPEPPAD